jgi:hypothetical protein
MAVQKKTNIPIQFTKENFVYANHSQRGIYLCAELLTIQNNLFNMKKMLLGLFAMATLGLASCGETLLTPEQVQAEITKGIDAGKAAIVTEESAACDATFTARVDEQVAAKKAEMEAMKAAEMEAMKAAPKKK